MSCRQALQHSTTTAVPYLGSVPLYDLLGCGVKLALQLAALLPIIKHLHLVDTKLGATQVNSKEVTLLCNTSGQPSLEMAMKRGSNVMLKATAQGPSSPQPLLPHHGRSLSYGLGSIQKDWELETLSKAIRSLLLAWYAIANLISIWQFGFVRSAPSTAAYFQAAKGWAFQQQRPKATAKPTRAHRGCKTVTWNVGESEWDHYL